MSLYKKGIDENNYLVGAIGVSGDDAPYDEEIINIGSGDYIPDKNIREEKFFRYWSEREKKEEKEENGVKRRKKKK